MIFFVRRAYECIGETMQHGKPLVKTLQFNSSLRQLMRDPRQFIGYAVCVEGYLLDMTRSYPRYAFMDTVAKAEGGTPSRWCRP